MTPQEYIRSEQRRALKWHDVAMFFHNRKASEKLMERFELLVKIESELKGRTYRKKEARRLMQAAAEALAAEDSPDVDYAIAARVDGIEYTMQDVVFGLCEIADRWEEEEQ